MGSICLASSPMIHRLASHRHTNHNIPAALKPRSLQFKSCENSEAEESVFLRNAYIRIVYTA
jgi:hypothetical protein